MTLGSTIGIFAPSSSIIPEKFEVGLQILKGHGYNTIVHPQTYIGAGEQTQIAGTTEQKVQAYKELVADQSVGLIIAATGGNRACFLLDELAPLKSHKPIMGFSDVTALLSLHYKLGTPSIFGPTIQTLARMDENHIHLTFEKLNSLTQTATEIEMVDSITLNKGEVTAPIFAATLSVLNTLIGTKHMPDLNGHILVIEDIGEELNSIDRMLWHLFSVVNPSAIIFGQFVDLKDTGRPYGQNIKHVLAAYTQKLGIPVIMNAPIDHYGRIFPITCGQTAKLDATNRILIL
ncbi:MAG: LD-carboxypeptidase [Pseudobdellovibrionaceae bacterium]|jgi:muramoyltetrapeptide carboxypeptidase|nr:LD-carboxypeptidase [Pseudobdellovibrionaceae bacterium]